MTGTYRDPRRKVVQNLAYREGPGSHPAKHSLDLYLPEGRDWPVVVFVHGGGWNTGDKAQRVEGVEIYADVGRFFASKGVGAAVVNYRLLPEVSWRGQIEDVAGAVAWVHRNIAEYGGDPKRLFLSGHSAGAQLAARVALDPEPLKSECLSKAVVSGVIAVSGAAYELSADAAALRGGRKGYYERRFGKDDSSGTWAEDVSILRFVDKSAPPFLILYGSAEPKSLIQQSELLNERLRAAGASVTLQVIPHRDHVRTVLTMSRDEGETTKTMLSFIQSGVGAVTRWR